MGGAYNMAWRLTAKKGNMVTRSGSKKKELIDKHAKRLRDNGWNVRVYKVK